MRVAIVGLGYVGLPLSLQFARSGVTVLGLDVDAAKVDALHQGKSYIKHIPSEAVAEVVRAGTFSAATDFSRIREVDAIIICVPTPLNKNREPDISFILDTGRSIARHLRKGMLVVLESTTYPGTTDEDLREVLEVGSGLEAGRDFHLAFSPEREDPGNPDSKVAVIPKVVGGYTPACLEKAVALYSKAVKTVVPVSSCRAAEATKLLENTFRGVNIALVNELKMVYSAMGIDVWEVINAAKTKPFGFMPFYPGPGLGGHCIPIDPFYLTWKAREYGQNTRFIELAGEINTSMPALCGAPRGGRAQRPAEGDQRKLRPGARAGLQAQRGRRARVAQLCAYGNAQGARSQSCLLRSLRAGDQADPRTCALGRHKVGRVEQGDHHRL